VIQGLVGLVIVWRWDWPALAAAASPCQPWCLLIPSAPSITSNY